MFIRKLSININGGLIMNNNIGVMSSDNVDGLFDGMIAGQQQVQNAYQNASNMFRSNNPTQMPNMQEPRRNDGYFQQPYNPNQMYGGYQNNQPQQQVRQTYGYGYTENLYNPMTSMFGTTVPQATQDNAYYGFYNPAYGK
jgi:tetrahydromethanopterin S-methyltransferase subunit B